MTPNLDLLLLGFLYSTLIAGILITVVLLALAGLVLAFATGLFSIVAIDLYGVFALLSSSFDAAKADVELGLVLLLCTVLWCGVSASSASKLWVKRWVGALVEAVRRGRNHYS